MGIISPKSRGGVGWGMSVFLQEIGCEWRVIHAFLKCKNNFASKIACTSNCMTTLHNHLYIFMEWFSLTERSNVSIGRGKTGYDGTNVWVRLCVERVGTGSKRWGVIVDVVNVDVQGRCVSKFSIRHGNCTRQWRSTYGVYVIVCA